MTTLTDYLVFFATLLLLFFFIRAKNKRNGNRRHPPSLPSLPIVGSLPFIRDFDDVPGFLMQKASELGPVFTLKFGSRLVAILNDVDAIEDAFVKHGSSFAGRGGFFLDEYIVNPNQKGIITKNYDTDLRTYRKITVSILKDFGYGSESKTEYLTLKEIAHLIDHIKKTNGNAFDPNEMLTLSVSNVLFSVLYGRRRNFEDGSSDMYKELNSIIESASPVIELFPILRFVPPFRQKTIECQQHNAKLMEIIRREIDESLEDKSVDCFVRRYAERLQGRNYDHEQLVYTMRDLYGGGAETTPAALLWAIVNLANNPHVAERVQKEIDAVVPRDRLPSSDDRGMLPYTMATILEVLRHRTVGPLAIPHLTLHDTEVMGYFIPANTVVLPNLMSANMNPKDWLNAEVFRPERFLDQENKLIAKNRLITFSAGRRACAGEEFGRHQMFMFLSGLMQNFTILKPEGIDSIDDKMKRGITTVPYPFKIRMIPREL